MEELGKLARVLRRHGQGRAPINRDELAVEAADIVIAAVCLFVSSPRPQPAWTQTRS